MKWIENCKNAIVVSFSPKPRKSSKFWHAPKFGLKSRGHRTRYQGPENQLPLLTMFLVHLLSRLRRIPTRESVVWTKISRHEKGRLVQNRCCHICNGDLKAAARSENYSYSSLQNAGDKNGMRIERIVWNNSPTTKKHLHLITGYNCNSYTARARDPDPLISQFWNTYSQITFQ